MLVTPIDEKPKIASDARSLARVRDIERDPRITMLVDRWHEDWSQLAWLRLDGEAHLVWPEERLPERNAAIQALRDRYPQYRTHELGSLPLIWMSVASVRWWAAQPAD